MCYESKNSSTAVPINLCIREEQCYLQQVAEIISGQSKDKVPTALRGYGMFRDVIELPPNWGTQTAREQDERELLASIEDREMTPSDLSLDTQNL